MKEHITKEEALFVCKGILKDITGFDYEPTIEKCLEGIEPADVVEVIRCRDCGKSITDTDTTGRVWCRKCAEYVKENGYCSDGIPKE